MLTTLRKIRESDSGATGLSNGLFIVLVVVSAVTILGRVESSVRGVFHNSAVQADTDRQLGRR